MTQSTEPDNPAPLTQGMILRLWWPLAASWLLMGAEGPMFNAVAARMPEEGIHLSAYGSIVFPIALVVEGPIIMLLAASTALCKDLASYRKLYRFMMVAGLVLTGVHAAIAFTPLFDWIARSILKAEEAVIEPARLGLQILTPWTWSIAHRRFHQGVLIRHGRTRPVGLGTVVRLIANSAVLVGGFLWARSRGYVDTPPSIAIGCAGISAGVLAEAAFIRWRVTEVLEGPLASAPPVAEPVTRTSFLRFYVPLALTPLLTLLIQPIGSMAMWRLPDNLDSTGAWSSVYSVIFLLRSFGFAFNEVVVSQLDRPRAIPVLRRFAWRLAFTTSAVLAVVAATPLGNLWLERVLDLEPRLVQLGTVGLAFGVLMPSYAVLQSWYQGTLVHVQRTRGITEAVTVYLVVTTSLLALAVQIQPGPGLPVVLTSFTVAGILQTLWLRFRSAPFLQR